MAKEENIVCKFLIEVEDQGSCESDKDSNKEISRAISKIRKLTTEKPIMNHNLGVYNFYTVFTTTALNL